MEFTPLERRVLDWIAANANEPVIASQLASAQPVSREFTGCGSFTGLRVSKYTPRFEHRTAPVYPIIESPELETV
jgi:hypothetical protein